MAAGYTCSDSGIFTEFKNTTEKLTLNDVVIMMTAAGEAAMNEERSLPKYHLTVWESILFCAFVALVTWSVMNTRLKTVLTDDPEVEPYRARYGPARYSAGPEEWLIRDFFHDRRDGTFLDVGAADYKDDNNTYYLETQLGWHGVAVDALSRFAKGYERYRPRTRFFAFFVAERSGENTTIYVNPLNTELSSSDRQSPASRGPTFGQQVPTISLNDLLDKLGIRALDFMNMDIEMAEPRALAGFDIGRFHPALVCIESHLQVRQQILDYFASHGYTVVAPYLRADRANLYFTSIASRP
jgi:FkbM family methyltransferase